MLVKTIAIIRIAGKCRAGRPRPAVLPQTARRVVAPYRAPLSAILDPAIDKSPPPPSGTAAQHTGVESGDGSVDLLLGEEDWGR